MAYPLLAVGSTRRGAWISTRTFSAFGYRPNYRLWVRLGKEHTVVARCSWCTMPIVEAEVDPASGKPFMLDGRLYHQECRDYRR
jgi:hypothetical protein